MWLKSEVQSGTVGWQGQEYAVKQGLVEVPDEAAPDLLSHGLVPSGPPEAINTPLDPTSIKKSGRKGA